MTPARDSQLAASGASEIVAKALHRAYSLGQIFWQQADSESYKQNVKADETQAKFDKLVADTVAALPASPTEPLAGQAVGYSVWDAEIDPDVYDEILRGALPLKTEGGM